MNSEGVKKRFDNEGTEFGRIHRSLPKDCAMFDIDAIKAEAKVELFMSKEDTIFIEYKTDFNNKSCKFKAMFELKFKDSDNVKKQMEGKMGTSIFAQVQMCKMLNMRYFYIIANYGKSPFLFYEWNYDKNQFIFAYELTYEVKNSSEAINKAWKELKLM